MMLFSVITNASARTLLVICSAIALMACLVFFAVDLRYGMIHFDTYQYSAAVGPQADGLRPKLPGLGPVPEFEHGSELSLPGVFWVKRLLFLLIPYSLPTDQLFCLACLVVSAALAACILQSKGWNGLTIASIFCMILLDRTFLTNVSGTRPESIAIMLLLSGYAFIMGGRFWMMMAGGLCLGFAGTMHIYAVLMAPVLAAVSCLNGQCTLKMFPWRKGLLIMLGMLVSWLSVVLFWWMHPDAWKLFTDNFLIQRSFHNNSSRFFGYISSFRLGAGWMILLLLSVFAALACRQLRITEATKRPMLWFFVTIFCLFAVPLSFSVLKTEQYFYGVFVWLSVVAGFPSALQASLRWRNAITAICLFIALTSLIRLGARVKLGFDLKGSESMHELRKEWLATRVKGAPRLYYFTYEWDIAHQVGVSDVRFYTFPLPTLPDILVAYETTMLQDMPDGSMLLFERDHADHCPYANKGAFDPKLHGGWRLLETKTWHYDLSPAKPAASVWELWTRELP